MNYRYFNLYLTSIFIVIIYINLQGCQPYEIKPCHGNIKKCFAHKTIETPKCKPYCYNSQYTQKYKDDLRKGME